MGKVFWFIKTKVYISVILKMEENVDKERESFKMVIVIKEFGMVKKWKELLITKLEKSVQKAFSKMINFTVKVSGIRNFIKVV